MVGRSNCVRRRHYLFLIVLAAFAAGCGGTTGQPLGPPGEITGVVFDTSGNVVRNANVTVLGNIETVSNSSGTYILHDGPAADLILHAHVAEGGVNYVGENLARVFSNDRSKSVN